MKTFRVYFRDGKQKVFEAPHIAALIRHITEDFTSSYGVFDIIKVEEETK